MQSVPLDASFCRSGGTGGGTHCFAERGRVQYDDAIARWVPELGDTTPGITFRHLLTHTSGIPDVGDLGIDRPDLRERDVLDAIRTHHGRFAPPGQQYRYSNTGYILLAMAVE